MSGWRFLPAKDVVVVVLVVGGLYAANLIGMFR